MCGKLNVYNPTCVPQVLKRVARLCGARILASTDHMMSAQWGLHALGTCGRFRLVRACVSICAYGAFLCACVCVYPSYEYDCKHPCLHGPYNERAVGPPRTRHVRAVQAGACVRACACLRILARHRSSCVMVACMPPHFISTHARTHT
jgi:hypothetical protein